MTQIGLVVEEAIGAAVGGAVVAVPTMIMVWVRYLRPWLDAVIKPRLDKVDNIDNAVNHGRMQRIESRLGVVEQDTAAIRAEMARRFDMVSEQQGFILDALRSSK